MSKKLYNFNKLGVPYQGSKGRVIERISKFFPNSDNFYDLFGGGFSVSHYMLEYRRNSFKTFHYNEIRKGMCELIQDSISGKYNYNVFKPEWITREMFDAQKSQDAYIKIIWSFGNNGENYLFGKDIESEKRSMHMAVVFDEFNPWFIETFKITKWPIGFDITEKRLYLKKIVTKLMRSGHRLEQLERLQQLQQLERLQQLQQLQRIQQLEQLERLQQLQQLERLQFTNLDYRQVSILPNSVIYCDIPYKSTAGYGNTFNHTEFFNWAHDQKNTVFISEYKVDDNRFYLLKEFSHSSAFSSSTNNKVVERLYGNKVAFDIIQKFRLKS